MERVHRPWSAAAAAVVFVGMGLVACGGSSTTTIPDATTGGDGGAGGGGGGGEGGAGGYTLDDVCDKLAPVICGIRKPCCEKTSTYDEAGCIAHEKASCAKDVDAARAGTETFHPERIDPCVDKVKAVFDQCYSTFDLIYRALPILRDCRVFEGQEPVGTACERDSQCQGSSDPKEFVGCDSKTSTCKATKFLADGAPCSLADGVTSFCDQGLYCDVSFASTPLTGTCKTATALDKPCDATKKPFSLECGLGNYCAKDTARCTVAKGPGATCAGDDECATFKCAQGAGGKTCTSPDPLVKPVDCHGP